MLIRKSTGVTLILYIPPILFFSFSHKMTFCCDNCSTNLTDLEKQRKLSGKITEKCLEEVSRMSYFFLCLSFSK